MIDVGTRRLVHQRAGQRCEYCRLPEILGDVPFHVEHIVAKQHKQDDDPSNLALACDRCNLFKGPNLTSIDPETDEIANLYHPRKDVWSDHFMFRDAEFVGLTPTGRATIQLLQMNAKPRLELRQRLLADGQQL